MFKYRNAFKTRAVKIEKSLKDAGYIVSMNKEKPRKGCFVITQVGKETPFVELLALPRPFTKLKNLDVDKLISEIISYTA